jgi:hypothetical protein
VSRRVAELLKPGAHLVCYDMPRMSGLWGVLIAPSMSSIRARYPELTIVDSLPQWMEETDLASMRKEPLRVENDPPQGLLRALVADRQRQ